MSDVSERMYRSVRAQLLEVRSYYRAVAVRFSDEIEVWHSWGARFSHRGTTVTLRFSRNHPYEPTLIYLDPPPRGNKHWYVHQGEKTPRLCWCRPEQWHPDYSLAVAAGSAIRFINEYQAGIAY